MIWGSCHTSYKVLLTAGPSKVARLVMGVADGIQCRKMQSYAYRHEQELSVPYGSEGIGGGRGRKDLNWGANHK